jgi:hypothetical protein
MAFIVGLSFSSSGMIGPVYHGLWGMDRLHQPSWMVLSADEKFDVSFWNHADV